MSFQAGSAGPGSGQHRAGHARENRAGARGAIRRPRATTVERLRICVGARNQTSKTGGGHPTSPPSAPNPESLALTSASDMHIDGGASDRNGLRENSAEDPVGVFGGPGPRGRPRRAGRLGPGLDPGAVAGSSRATAPPSRARDGGLVPAPRKSRWSPLSCGRPDQRHH
jgi:hypothetical protein